MDQTKDQKDLDAPCQELFVRGLGFVVALPVCLGLDFRVRIPDTQSSCSYNLPLRLGDDDFISREI